MDEKKLTKIRKRNMKLYPTYKTLSWDYLFFYTINFLFLTQVKGITPADIVLIDSFYYVFAVFSQIPATFTIEFLGKKNSIILANILSCLYIVIIMCSRNLFNLIIAEIICAFAFAIKESAEPSLLNESIPPTSKRDRIFAKISSRGLSMYFVLNAISKMISGVLFEVNPYIPLTLSLATLIIVTILSTLFIEPIQKKKEKIESFTQIKDLKEAFKFVLRSERIKSLLLFSAIMMGLFSILANYEVSMFEDLNVSAKYLGIIFAGLNIISALAAKKQEKIHNKFTNKSLSILGVTASICCIFAGIFGVCTKMYPLCVFFIIVVYVVRHFIHGLYFPLMEKYLGNFTNEEIDTKIYTADNFFKSISSAIFGIFASLLLDRLETAICMICIGIVFGALFIFVSIFMKKRVGLNPNNYSKEDVKYDKIKVIK